MKQLISSNTILLFIILLLSGCDPEELDYNNTIVNLQFDSTSLAVHENQTELPLRISFDHPAVLPGKLFLSVSGLDHQRFVTEPTPVNGFICLDISKNQNFAIVYVKPVNNITADGNKTVVFSLSGVSNGYKAGPRRSSSIEIIDDDSTPIPQKSVANFVAIEGRMLENNAGGQTVAIQFSQALQAEGSIEILVESNNAFYGRNFETIPEAMNGRIVLNPGPGQRAATIKIIPINNHKINGELELRLTISSTNGSIETGTQRTQMLIIQDDELVNKPKGYEASGGLWGLKKVYEYDELGRISRVHIERASPAVSRRTETYFYDADGRISKINTYPRINILYTWQDNRIRKSETVDNGVVKEYTEYDYDLLGTVSGSANYYRQADGTFKLGSFIANLYFEDGNIYKSLVYIPVEGPEELQLISTRTYEGYLNADNPFPMVDILPTVRTQNKLPGVYRIQENGVDLRYTFSYQFRNDGLVEKRTTTGSQSVETAHYLYY